MIKIIPIPALHDNYIWMIKHPNNAGAIIVDPGEAPPVIEKLTTLKAKLAGIFITHHHWDHTAGARDLLNYFSVPIYGPPSVDMVSHPLKEGDTLTLDTLGTSFNVIEIPGHTLDHIAYYISKTAIFCGDTLFTAGCGRVFEGTFEQMYHSLQKLAALPAKTQIYCGHEYTQANLNFAIKVEPKNPEILKRIKEVTTLRNNNEPTVPATLDLELKTNPFLRCARDSIQQAASEYCKKKVSDPIQAFTVIRQWKDKC